MVLLTVVHFLQYILLFLYCSSLLLFLFSCSVISDCDPQDLQHARFLIIHHLLELAQTHVHPNSDGIQPSHPVLPPFPFPFHLSQHRGLYQWVSSSHKWPKVWNFNFSIGNPMNIQGWFLSGMIGLISFLSRGLWRVFSSPTIQKQQFFITQPSLWSSVHIHTWPLGKSLLSLDTPLLAM